MTESCNEAASTAFVVLVYKRREHEVGRIVGPFRSIRTAESWSEKYARDDDGPVEWSVEPMQRVSRHD